MSAAGRTALAVIIVSTGDEAWLARCLPTVFAHAGELELDVVVVDNSTTGGAQRLVDTHFPGARSLTCENHGFAHGNNTGYVTTSAPYVLFLNPDTEIITGRLDELVQHMDRHPNIGILGVRQVSGEGRLHPTMRRFPTPTRLLVQALVPERWMPKTMGLRVLEERAYDGAQRCDWTSGSFMLVRREAFEAAGPLDERFFLYNEEMDLCLRMARAGWQVQHNPAMTIVHHAGRAGANARLAAQAAFAWRQYLGKNVGGVDRILCRVALFTHFGARAVVACRGDQARRTASVAAFKTFIGLHGAPFENPAIPAGRTWLRRGLVSR